MSGRNWREFLRGLAGTATVNEPVRADVLEAAEEALDSRFPGELRELLLQSDGVVGLYGLGLVWTTDRIVRENRRFRNSPEFRSLYMPFDPLLFFADAGNGDQFALRVLDAQSHRADVYVWNHEDDSRTWCAGSMAEYLSRWVSGDLSV